MLRFGFLAVVVVLPGCGHADSAAVGTADGGLPDGYNAEAFDATAPMGICGAIVQQHEIEGFQHLPICSYIPYVTLPPNSGNHYPIWSAYETYTSAIPEGFWVHNLEHGTIALSYNCAKYPAGASPGCEADVAAAQAMIDALPADPECTALGEGVRRRSLMTPDPRLDVSFAASAWGWTLRAHCFDPTTFQAFALAHYNQGREDICANGEDLSVGVQAGCGDPP